ncbi:MAG: 3-phosphoshikimate 1-carboxyvinyltransferase, partial [Acidobacteriota bacterium]|nr:3-phosphoshikimate 1-carboxyvinyltransferase [Acidobacteriota bacterium]
MNWTVEPARHLSGDIVVPGDKSISHRTVLLTSVADGESVIDGLADGQDLASSIEAIRVLGAEVGQEGADLRIRGCGLAGLRQANQTINCGNSGTTMRLLAGLLAGQHFTSELTGDASLCSRPMRRVAEPLRAMGASVRTSRDGTPPLEIAGRGCLRAITFHPEVAS